MTIPLAVREIYVKKCLKDVICTLYIVGCGLGVVKMDQSGSEWVRVGQSGSEHRSGLVLPILDVF